MSVFDSGLRLLNVKELAERFNVSESWVRKQVFYKKIPFLKINNNIRFHPCEIQAWLKKCSSEA